MHIIIQEQFQSESLKEFKQKDIDLQYILMCVYILKKVYFNQILWISRYFFLPYNKQFDKEKKSFLLLTYK